MVIILEQSSLLCFCKFSIYLCNIIIHNIFVFTWFKSSLWDELTELLSAGISLSSSKFSWSSSNSTSKSEELTSSSSSTVLSIPALTCLVIFSFLEALQSQHLLLHGVCWYQCQIQHKSFFMKSIVQFALHY